MVNAAMHVINMYFSEAIDIEVAYSEAKFFCINCKLSYKESQKVCL